MSPRPIMADQVTRRPSPDRAHPHPDRTPTAPAAGAGRAATRRLGPLLALIAAALAASGCGLGPWLAHGVAGGEKTVKVKADYHNLENQRIAVLVTADEHTLYRAPEATEKICRSVSAHIAENVDGAQLMNPRQIVQFQDENPYWSTMRAGRLIEKLDTDRLVLIDLVEYRFHEPGNSHLWHGLVTGNVAVHEADGNDPDNPAYYRTVTTSFPEDTRVGVVDSDRETIELGMVKTFGRDVARLFHLHEKKVED